MTRLKMLLLSAIFSILISCSNGPVFHTLSYDAGGAADIPSVLVLHGNAIGEENLPTLSDIGQKSFLGWYFEGRRIYPDYKVKSDMTLKAVWDENATGGDEPAGDDNPSGAVDPKKKMVVLGYASSIGHVPSSLVVPRGELISSGMLEPPEGSDLSFAGWYFNGEDKVSSDSLKIEDDTTLVAGWNGDGGTHLLYFYYTDAGDVGESYYVNHGENASELPVFIPQGAVAWRTEDGVIWDLSWPVYSNFCLYAVYDMVDVGFYDLGGNLLAEISISKGAKVPKMDLPEGAAGWFTEDGVLWDFSIPADKTLSLYAHKSNPVVFNISYDSGAYGQHVPSISVPNGYILQQKDLPLLSYDQVVFSGWFDQDGNAVSPGYRVDRDMVLKALWLENVDDMDISNLSLLAHEDSVTLSWVNPSFSNFEKVKVEIRKESSSIGMRTEYISGNPGGYMVHEFQNLESGHEYDFRLYPVFKDGSEGTRAKVTGIPSRYVGKTVWVHGIEPPAEDRWMAETDRLREQVVRQDDDLWFDVNKTYLSDKEEYPYDKSKWAPDSNLCWAAGSANVIHWWMHNNKDYIERFGKYDGPSMEIRSDIRDKYPRASEFQKSEIFQYFIDNSWDEMGYDEEGVNWFLSGADYYISSPIFNSRGTGGFFREVFQGRALSTMSKDLGKGSMGQAFIEAFDKNMAINYTSMSPSIPLGHIMTIWGAEFDEQGYVSFVYSVDNNLKGLTGHVPEIMTRCAIGYQINPEGATRAVIENYVKDVFYIIKDFRFISLGTEMWEEYFRNNP